MQPNLRMIFENRLEQLNHLMGVARAYLKPFDLGSKARFAVELILEEAVTNVINHGFEETSVAEVSAEEVSTEEVSAEGSSSRDTHLIAVNLAVIGDEVHLQVADEGRPFTPLAVPRLDVNQPFMERLEGGLGIHLVRQMMNSMAYRREGERNIFEIWIRDRDGNGTEDVGARV
jgi:anti-sigma regulatory factor (Ser/Thr protein kinase)